MCVYITITVLLANGEGGDGQHNFCIVTGTCCVSCSRFGFQCCRHSCLRTTTSHTTWVAQREEVGGLENQAWQIAKMCSHIHAARKVGPIGLYGVCDGHGPFGHLVSFRLVTWPTLILPKINETVNT